MPKKKPKPKSAKPKSKAKKSVSRKKTAKPKAKQFAPRLKPIPGQPATLIVAAPEKRLVGKVKHFYNKIGVGIIELTGSDLSLGDEISIEGPHTKVQQKVSSMQVEHESVSIGRKGQIVGLKVSDRVRENDAVYKVIRKI